MFGLFKRDKPLSEVAAEFIKQLDIVRIVLFKYFEIVIRNACEKTNTPITDDDKATYAAAAVQYLTAEDLDAWVNGLKPPQKKFAKTIISNLVEQVDGVLALDKSLREAVVYTLRMMAITDQWNLKIENPSDYFKTPRCQRMDAILQKYGGEFPKHVDPGMYSKIVRGLMMTDSLRKDH